MMLRSEISQMERALLQEHSAEVVTVLDWAVLATKEDPSEWPQVAFQLLANGVKREPQDFNKRPRDVFASLRLAFLLRLKEP